MGEGGSSLFPKRPTLLPHGENADQFINCCLQPGTFDIFLQFFDVPMKKKKMYSIIKTYRVGERRSVRGLIWLPRSC